MRRLIVVVAVLLSLVAFGCERGQQQEEEAKEKAEQTATEQEEANQQEAEADKPGTIVEVAEEAGSFETLVTAIDSAELTDALSAEGPYTVFAPTDDAFDALPEGTVEDLLKPENKEKLQSILKYHVLSGKVMAEDVESGEVETLQGAKAQIEVTDEGVTYSEANVTNTDIEASNGVIHVIDKVVMPPEKEPETEM